MIKYIKAAGYKFAQEANDLTDKQFTLNGVEYASSQSSTFGSFKMDREETYSLFLKNFDSASFNTKLETIINGAYAGSVAVADATVSADKQENGYLVVMKFYIRSV